ncbi:NADPH-dependent FMN reductase [Variovorax sp. PBL-E5]|uniref:NADPH-dependent FMN reductase n=1 Tax=Variovorax sp. PBL-E5 TaxID=434014 RepID=UPI001315F6A2|nr:NAD(P)H-dependent oxidoreductase [Variovorax sp. PBL-E5]VTU39985.1 FMN-dependent NADPH-azoreductase [Variovorax sp. PBL-E5]
MVRKPYIVGIGGTGRDNSSTELALRASLAHARRLGARTELFAGADLDLPMYTGQPPGEKAGRLIEAIRRSDGVLLASPGYHGSISGMVKNALDYVEELRGDERPYLEGRAVGSIVCAYGSQAIGTTIVAVRCIVHALRGWPTPAAAGINSVDLAFDEEGRCTNAAVQQQLELVARQVCEFGAMYVRMEPCAEMLG